MLPFALILVGVGTLVTGIRAFGCESVSFGGDLMTCIDTTAGDFPGDAAGGFLLGVSALLILVGASTFARRR